MKLDKELHQLDLPDAYWSRYRGPGGMNTPHAITLPEQAALLQKKPHYIASRSHWPAGRWTAGVSSGKVYRRGDAWGKHEAARERTKPRLHLVTPTSD